MTFGAVSSDHWAGEAQTGTDAKATFLSEARAANLLWVDLTPPRPTVRGRLCLYIEGAIERALDARGAPPPGALATTAPEQIVLDQIRRALVSGTSGFALWFSSLEAIAGPERALDTADSRTLCFWLDAANEHPVRLGFDAANRMLGVYLAPQTLDSLLEDAASDAAEVPEPESDARHPSASDPYAASFDTDPSELAPNSEAPTVDNRTLAGRSEPDDEARHEPNVPQTASEARADADAGPNPVLEVTAERGLAQSADAGPNPVLEVTAERGLAQSADGGANPAPEVTAERGLAESARAMAEQIAEDSDTGWLRHALMELSTPKPGSTRGSAAATVPDLVVPVAGREPHRSAPTKPATSRVEVAPGGTTPGSSSEEASPKSTDARDSAEPSRLEPLRMRIVDAPPPAAAPVEEPACEHAAPGPAHADERNEREDAGIAATGPRLELRLADAPAPSKVNAPDVEAETKRKLEACWRELSAATGPKPLAVVERLFSTAYMPLRTALDRGANMPALRETADDWSQSFEKSYKDGFDALRVRNKRPSMVVDVADLALRVARLHGARSTQLLLVDAMRYDLGEMVNQRIAAIVGQRAACAERFLLWAALPTNSATQIELIGRGSAGLREPITATGDELVVGRGRKAQMVRRLKTGHRELLKLDIVAARLAEPHGGDPCRFEEIADEVAQRIAAHFEGLPPRTLVVIFGDHGFTVDRHTDGRTSVTEGGASPEEVMVPAFAWLVGAVH